MLLVVAVVIAALGLIAHNLISLPLSPLAPETVGPVLVYAGLLGWSPQIAAGERVALVSRCLGAPERRRRRDRVCSTAAFPAVRSRSDLGHHSRT